VDYRRKVVEHVLPIHPVLTPNSALAALPKEKQREFMSRCKASLVQLFSPYVSSWVELCNDLVVEGDATIDPDDPKGPVIAALRKRVDDLRSEIPQELQKTQVTTPSDSSVEYRAIPTPPWYECVHVEHSTLQMTYDEESELVSYSNSATSSPAVQLNFSLACTAC